MTQHRLGKKRQRVVNSRGLGDGWSSSSPMIAGGQKVRCAASRNGKTRQKTTKVLASCFWTVLADALALSVLAMSALATNAQALCVLALWALVSGMPPPPLLDTFLDFRNQKGVMKKQSNSMRRGRGLTKTTMVASASIRASSGVFQLDKGEVSSMT